MIWKTIFQDTKKESYNQQRYGLRSFENIKFQKLKNHLQNQLKENIKKINQSNKTLTFADRSSNMYRLTKEEFFKMRRTTITSTNKKTNSSIKKIIGIK